MIMVIVTISVLSDVFFDNSLYTQTCFKQAASTSFPLCSLRTEPHAQRWPLASVLYPWTTVQRQSPRTPLASSDFTRAPHKWHSWHGDACQMSPTCCCVGSGRRATALQLTGRRSQRARRRDSLDGDVHTKLSSFVLDVHTKQRPVWAAEHSLLRVVHTIAAGGSIS